MQINRSGYENMDWVLALKAKLNPPSDFSPETSSSPETQEVVDGALEQTCKAAFNTPTNEKNNAEIIREESSKIADASRANSMALQAQSIRAKLQVRGIDPVAMGIANQREWASSDPALVEAIAKEAIKTASTTRDRSWESVQPARQASGFDDASKLGQVIPAGTRREDVVDHKRNIPSNLPSIFDPNRLKELSESENPHDQSVSSIRKSQKDRENHKKSEFRSNMQQAPEDFVPMKGGRSMAISGKEHDVMVHRVPRNQLSMLDGLDDHKKLSQAEMTEKLKAIFMGRVGSPRERTRQANEERKAEISRDKKQKHEFKVEPPKSTADSTKRLMDLWAEEEGE